MHVCACVRMSFISDHACRVSFERTIDWAWSPSSPAHSQLSILYITLKSDFLRTMLNSSMGEEATHTLLYV